MAHALPIAKLAGLLIKTLAKPVSKRIKHEFNRTETTRQILHTIGQTSHQITSRLTIWSAGYKVRQITPLPADNAIQIGSEFIGESFVLIVSASTVLYEYNRSILKEEKKSRLKQEQAMAEKLALQHQLQEIYTRLNVLEEQAQQAQQQATKGIKDSNDENGKESSLSTTSTTTTTVQQPPSTTTTTWWKLVWPWTTK